MKRPDKIIVLIDRENREDCSPELARQGLQVIAEELAGFSLSCPVRIIVSDKYFECTLFADYGAVDAMPILARPVSPEFGEATDGKNVLAILNAALRPGASYHKKEHGLLLARSLSLNDEEVARRSRSLRKFLREVPRIEAGGS